jgi:hypothetical protein
MTKLKCWKRTKLVTNPKSEVVYEHQNGNKILWIQKSNVYGGKMRLGGVNKRGYIKDKYFKNKSEALKSVNKYMKSHDKC